MEAWKSELQINLTDVCVVFMDSKTHDVEIGVKNSHLMGIKVLEKYLICPLDF